MKEQDKVELRKKSMANKSSLDPMTLKTGNLNDIDDTVREATVELLQQFK